MEYNILEARIEFKENKIERITVLVDCTSSVSEPLTDLRAIFATTKPCSGYMHLPANAEYCKPDFSQW